MVAIRVYRASDAEEVGILIADTYAKFNLAQLSPREQAQHLGPFQHARSLDESRRAAIAEVIAADIVLVAELDGRIVGVLRGSPGRLRSLFVAGECHRQGIGRKLVGAFEQECTCQGSNSITVGATLAAIPFYLALGYKKSTGLRPLTSFEGRGLTYQPMKKRLIDNMTIAPLILNHTDLSCAQRRTKIYDILYKKERTQNGVRLIA